MRRNIAVTSLAFAVSLVMAGNGHATTRVLDLSAPSGDTVASTTKPLRVQMATKGPESKGPFSSLARRLAGDGIYLRANLINQYSDATAGGVTQGHTNVGQFNMGADIDLARMWGITGGSFHFTVYRDYGNGLNHDLSGTFFKQQYVYKNEYPRWHLGLFAYEQKALDDRLEIIVGRLGATSYYGHLLTNCQFQAGVMCGARELSAESGLSLMPSATWGANVRYRPTAHTYVETGAFEVNPTVSASNGLDFSIADSTGITVPFEVGYAKTNLATVRYPFELKIGGFVSTAPRADPFYNAAGLSRGFYGGSGREVDSNRDGVYLMGDRVLWRPDPLRNERITAFAGMVQQLEETEIMRQQIYTGFVWTGPFRGRPNDTFGLLASYFDLTPREVEYLRDARIKAGGTGSNNPHEVTFELNYGLRIARGVTLMPNVQYTIHPDNSSIPKTRVLPKNLFAFGLDLNINLSRALGFISAPKN